MESMFRKSISDSIVFEDGLERQLNEESILSEKNLARATKEDLMGLKRASVVGEYDDLSMPPNILISKLHWDCTRIGAPKDPNTGLSISCPCCQETQTKKYPFCTNPFNIRGHGTTIQIYYFFNLCCIILTVIAFGGMFTRGMTIRSWYCELLKEQKDQECSFLDTGTPKIVKVFLKNDPPRLQEYLSDVTDSNLIGLISVFTMYIPIIVFSIIKTRYRLKYLSNKKDTMVSEFTVMVHPVEGRGGLQPIYHFINSMMREVGLKEPVVVKAVLATSLGVLERTRVELAQKKERMVNLEAKCDQVIMQENNQDAQIYLESLGKLKKICSKETEKLGKKVKKLEKSENSKNLLNSTAFITFQTNAMRQQVIQAYQKLHGNHRFCCFFGSQSRKSRYRIQLAPEPENINWVGIGKSSCQKAVRASLTRPLLGFMIPVFMILFIGVNIVFLILHIIFKGNHFEIFFINIGFFVAIKVFTLLSLWVVDLLNDLELNIVKNDHLARKVLLVSMMKIFFFYIATQFSIYNTLIDNKPKEDDAVKYNSKQSEIAQMAMIGDKIIKYLITSLYLVPGLLIFQVKYVFNEIQRYRIKKLFDKKKSIESDAKNDKALFQTQGMLNDYFERPEPDFGLKYTNIYSLMIMMAAIGHYCPLLIMPLVFVAIFVISLIELKLFYSRYKKPLKDIESLRIHMIRRLVLVPKFMHIAINLLDEVPKGWQPSIPEICFRVILTALLVLDFNWILGKVESWTKEHFLRNNKFKVKYYEESLPQFSTDYELEYLGKKRTRDWVKLEVEKLIEFEKLNRNREEKFKEIELNPT